MKHTSRPTTPRAFTIKPTSRPTEPNEATEGEGESYWMKLGDRQNNTEPRVFTFEATSMPTKHVVFTIKPTSALASRRMMEIVIEIVIEVVIEIVIATCWSDPLNTRTALRSSST